MSFTDTVLVPSNTSLSIPPPPNKVSDGSCLLPSPLLNRWSPHCRQAQGPLAPDVGRWKRIVPGGGQWGRLVPDVGRRGRPRAGRRTAGKSRSGRQTDGGRGGTPRPGWRTADTSSPRTATRVDTYPGRRGGELAPHGGRGWRPCLSSRTAWALSRIADGGCASSWTADEGSGLVTNRNKVATVDSRVLRRGKLRKLAYHPPPATKYGVLTRQWPK